MKDHRTHLAHKAGHAVDLQTGAVVAVTVQDADEGDTATEIGFRNGPRQPSLLDATHGKCPLLLALALTMER
jgi:hypothetical protein